MTITTKDRVGYLELLSERDHAPVTTATDLADFELVDATNSPLESINGQAIWLKEGDVHVLCQFESSDNNEYPYYRFSFVSGEEEITLQINGEKQENMGMVLSVSLGRNTHTLDDIIHSMPRGIGMTIYDKLPQFLNSLTNQIGKFTHVLKKGVTNGSSLEFVEWEKKFLPFVKKYGYQKQQRENDPWPSYYKEYPTTLVLSGE